MIRRLLRWLWRALVAECPGCAAHQAASAAVRDGGVPCSMCQRPAAGVLLGVPWCRECVPTVVTDGGAA